MLHKSLVQKRYSRSISGHQETLVHFQDLTVCVKYAFTPENGPTSLANLI
jgi:hypothetical protein